MGFGGWGGDSDARKLDAAEARQTVRRAMRLFVPYKGEVTKTLLAVLVGVSLGLAPPFFLKIIIDEGITENNLRVVTIYSILTVLATLLGAGVTLLYGYWSVVMGQRIMCDLRGSLFEHLQRMSLRFFTSTRTGEIQTRLISDVQGVQDVLSTTITDAVSNAAIVVSALIAMFILDWRLTLMSLAMVPLFAWFGKWLGQWARDVTKGTQEQTAEINSMMQETLSVSGILLTKTVGRLAPLLKKFDVENRALAGWQVKSMLIQYVFFGLIRMITTLAPALVYWLAGYLLFRGDQSITIGVIVAFTALQIRMFFPVTSLLGLQVQIMSSLALFDRLFEYLDLPRDVQERPDALAIDPRNAQGRVTFEGVFFKYEDTEDWTLEDVSFAAEPGELVALVGPSGAGKTTLTYLIPRLYDVDKGGVAIDGIDVRDLTLQTVGDLVGAVTQETYLLHDTIRANLMIARPNATEQELIEACQSAAIHSHIATLPLGYDTIVGERGYKLSGGEKQRLAIARAILKNPKILILDEATSALDTHSERLIQNSLETLMEGRTTFAIAHRLSTILHADRILVLDRGRVVEMGRHAELLAQGGLYKKLYEEQFRSDNPGAQLESPRPSGG